MCAKYADPVDVQADLAQCIPYGTVSIKNGVFKLPGKPHSLQVFHHMLLYSIVSRNCKLKAKALIRLHRHKG